MRSSSYGRDWRVGVTGMYGRETVMLRVEGHAMAPEFEDGSWVWADPDEPMAAGRFVAVAEADGRGTLVRLLVEEEDRLLLRALDPAFADIEFDEDLQWGLHGVVVFKGKRP